MIQGIHLLFTKLYFVCSLFSLSDLINLIVCSFQHWIFLHNCFCYIYQAKSHLFVHFSRIKSKPNITHSTTLLCILENNLVLMLNFEVRPTQAQLWAIVQHHTSALFYCHLYLLTILLCKQPLPSHKGNNMTCVSYPLSQLILLEAE